MTERLTNKNISWIELGITVLLFLGGLAGMWANITTNQAVQNQQLIDIDKKVDSVVSNLQQYQTKQSNDEADIAYLKAKIK